MRSSILSQTGPAPLALHYADAARAAALLARPDHVLGVVGYGGEQPAGPVFLSVPLAPVARAAAFEIWTSATPVRACQIGPVAGACGDEFAFGCIRLAEAGRPLEDAAEDAYRAIFEFLAGTGFTQPIRFWNYLADICAEQDGLERYRRFNIGRHRAFMDRLEQAVPPAASCLGTHGGGSVIYVLAAREAARAIENPRQMSAYDYPPAYGPRSPSFSRAALHGPAAAPMLFISGTASIVGHETRHHGDLDAQIAETITNLQALTGNAGATGWAGQDERWAFKIYLRAPDYFAKTEAALNAAFGPRSQRLYLHADICRPDLLVEIEAFYQAA